MGKLNTQLATFKDENRLFLDLLTQIKHNSRIPKLDHLVVDITDYKSVYLATFLSNQLSIPILFLKPREEKDLFDIIDNEYTTVANILIVKYQYEESFFVKVKAYLNTVYGTELFLVGACVYTRVPTNSKATKFYVFFVEFVPKFIEDAYLQGFDVEGSYNVLQSKRINQNHFFAFIHSDFCKELHSCFLLNGVLLDFHPHLSSISLLPSESADNFYVSKYVDKLLDIYLMGNNHHAYYLGAFTCFFTNDLSHLLLQGNYYKYLLANLRPIIIFTKGEVYIGTSNDLQSLASATDSNLMEVDYSKCTLLFNVVDVESVKVPNLRASFVSSYSTVY